MAKFKLQIDVEPEDIPSLDDSHKHDCADALTKTVNAVFKYTMLFSLITAGFYGAYSLINIWWMLRMEEELPSISPFIPFAALLILAVEFVSGTMNRWALILQIILHIVLIIITCSSLITLAAIPFAFYGIVQHVKLITLIPIYKAISSQKGYPDFMPPLNKDMLDCSAIKKDENEKISAETSSETGSKKDEIVDGTSGIDNKSSANNQ